MKNISLIVAMSNHRVIGVNNTLPWHLPEDLKRFRALTTGHHIIMGRKTYESLGRLLPNRMTVIVTRNENYKVEGALISHNLQDAINVCAHDDEVFIIGGAELYQTGLKYANKMYMTEVGIDVKGDAFFPNFDQNEWKESERENFISEKGLPFAYVTYVRNESNKILYLKTS